MKKIGFLSFGHWSSSPGSRTRSASDALLQSIDLAVAAEELGADGAYLRVHHFARQLGSPFPLLAAIGVRTSRIEIGTAVIDMRYENPLYMAEDAGAADLISGGRLQLGISRGSPEQVIEGWRYFGYQPQEGQTDAEMARGHAEVLAALNRVVDPCSKRAFADWWRTTAADRFTKIAAPALDHRRFWDAFHAVPLEALPRIEEKVALAACARFGLDTSSVALDMTNFATFIDTGNARAPIAQRGKAKQKRSDLRLVGLGLVVTRDGGIPLLSHAYPGNRPDVSQFPEMIKTLAARHGALAAAAGQDGTEMTVVFDAGQNSEANFALLAGTSLHYVGSVPASDCRDLLALPASARSVVDAGRFGGLTACDTRRAVYGTGRRAILTHSPELHQHQARGFDGTTLAKAGKKLDELAATLARGKTRRARAKVEAEIGKITHDAWVRRVVTWQLAGEQPKDFRLAWDTDQAARAALEEEIFGKHVLARGAGRRGLRAAQSPPDVSEPAWPAARRAALRRAAGAHLVGRRVTADRHVGGRAGHESAEFDADQ